MAEKETIRILVIPSTIIYMGVCISNNQVPTLHTEIEFCAKLHTDLP
jgi:hypothetical protein